MLRLPDGWRGMPCGCGAGQGTIGSEILRQTDMDELDYIFVAIGEWGGACETAVARAECGLLLLRHKHGMVGGGLLPLVCRALCGP